MNKNAGGDFAGTGPKFSWLASLNLFGGLTGRIRVPEALYNMMPGSRPGATEQEQKDAQLHAALLTLIGGSMVTGAAVTGIGRGLKALYDARMHKDNPVADMGAQTSTTYDLGSLGKDASVDKKAWEMDFPDKASMSTLFSVAAPVGAFILASAATSGLIDAASTSARGVRINRKIGDRRKLYNDLLSARARNARGTLTDSEYADLQGRIGKVVPNTVKEANFKIPVIDDIKEALGGAARTIGAGADKGARGIVAALGLIMAGVAGASGIASYTYTRASDPDNIKYKAIEKGLKEYAKGKSSTTPITMLSPGSRFFDSIDQGTPQKTVRDLPQVTTDDLNKPLSMTL